MNKIYAGLSFVAIVLTVGFHSAQAEVLEDSNNIFFSEVTGDDNKIYINQEYTAVSAATTNRIAASITGNRNGGYNPWSSRLIGSFGLEAGALIQTGFGHSLSLTVYGDDNVFAVTQVGQSNTVSGVITGFANQAAVMQNGTGNAVSFSQTGQHNTIIVSQTSY